jgi:hypothetical protein
MAMNFYAKIDGGWGIGFTLYEYLFAFEVVVEIKRF